MKLTLWFHGSIILLMLTLLAVRTAHFICAIKCCFACSLMEKNAQEQMYVLSEMEAHAGPW